MVWLVDSIQIHIHYHNKMFMVMQTMLRIASKSRMIFLARKACKSGGAHFRWSGQMVSLWYDGPRYSKLYSKVPRWLKSWSGHIACSRSAQRSKSHIWRLDEEQRHSSGECLDKIKNVIVYDFVVLKSWFSQNNVPKISWYVVNSNRFDLSLTVEKNKSKGKLK